MRISDVEVVRFADSAEFECWLAENCADQQGVWVQVARKHSGIPSVTDRELVEVGLCYGWISGQRRSFDEQYYLQKYVPRRPRSVWSQVNVEKVEALTATGRMREPGLAEVRRAQADGRWAAAYEPQKTAAPPPDLAAALDAAPELRKAFDGLGRTERYQLILPLLQARTSKARQTRLARALDSVRDAASR